MKLEYVVTVTSELSAGLHGFIENVTIEFESEQHPGAFLYFREALAEWFDVKSSGVVTKEEYDKHLGNQEETC